MAENGRRDVLILSAFDVARIALATADVEAVVRETLRAEAAGSFASIPRLPAQRPNTARFIAFPAILDHLGVAGVKWLGLGDAAPGAPQSTTSHILLSDARSGALAAIIDAGWITLARTVAVSLIAAKAVAPSASRVAGFIGCGRQAAAHLEALRSGFPLERIVAAGRSREGVEAFLREAERLGLEAVAAPSFDACLEESDIVVSTASSGSGDGRRADARRLREGSFASLVDLGRVWASPLPHGANVVVDDPGQYRVLARGGAVPDLGGAPTPLADLVARRGRSHAAPAGPTLFLPTGYGAADLALAARLWRDARAAGLGATIDLG